MNIKLILYLKKIINMAPIIICEGKYSINVDGVLTVSTLWRDVRVTGIHLFANQLIALANWRIMKVDKYHYHEVLDRLYVIQENIDAYILEHLVFTSTGTVANDLAKSKVTEALDLLQEAYQIIGGIDSEIN